VRELLLESKDMEKRREIAERLNSNPDDFENLLEEVFQSSEDEFVEERSLVLNLIDFLSDRLAIAVIRRALGYTDAKIRVKGLQAAYRRQIDSLNDQIEELLVDSTESFAIKKLAIHILGSTDPSSFGRLLRNIMKDQEGDIELRKEAIFALTTSPSNETVGALCILLGNANVEIRRSSAWALGKIGSEDSICCLLAALEDSDGQVIDWSIRGLRDMDSTRALQGLADVITRSAPEEQERLIRLVVEKKSEITLRAIAELMESDEVSVRRIATWAMAVSPYPPAVGMLEKLVNDDDIQIRDYAKKALVRLGRIDPTDSGLLL
jgi:HEAT repeat protein